MNQAPQRERRQRLRRMRAVAREALRHYPFAGARVTFLGHSENVTYRLDVPASGNGEPERYLLRVHKAHTDELLSRLTHTRPASEAELRWLQALGEEAGLAVPQPFSNLHGELLTEVSANDTGEMLCCSVPRWVEGRRGSIATLRTAAKVGALLAAIHRQS